MQSRKARVSGTLVRIIGSLIFGVALLAGCASPSQEAPPKNVPSSDQQLINEALDRAWAEVQRLNPDMDRPEVAIIRLTSYEEWAEVMAQCLNEHGFEVTETGDGGYSTEALSRVQQAAFEIARYVCTAQYPLDPKYRRAPNDQQMNALYDYYVGELTECVTNLGYEVSPSPSRQEFLDTYDTDPWLPFDDAVHQAEDGEALTTLTHRCPQLPSDFFD